MQLEESLEETTHLLRHSNGERLLLRLDGEFSGEGLPRLCRTIFASVQTETQNVRVRRRDGERVRGRRARVSKQHDNQERRRR